ncbi:Lrp/AsnC family transcriptional regulator [Clostridium neonatale]|uniref:Lrp/AsnC family transcriptional regulator n=1 Tax=Clostridium neonatale TaxID=137838 RepID=UPI00397906E7
MIKINVDNIDMQIIDILSENSKLSFKEIGDNIHLTGQAVGSRVSKLIENGIIEKFTLKINKELLGINIIALIKVYMKTNNHNRMIEIINNNDEIVEAHRVSSDACYFLKLETDSNNTLNRILDEINEFANYQLSLSVNKIK